MNTYLIHSLTAQAIIFLYIITEPEVRMSLQNCDSDNLGSTFEKDATDQVMNKTCSVQNVEIFCYYLI